MKRKVIITGLCLMLAFSLTACGGKTNEASNTEIGTEEGSTVASANNEKQNIQSETEEEVEIVEETGTSELLEDGSIVVITESGEELVVSENTQKVENSDGSITYTQENGTTITISSSGDATVTTEKPVQNNSSAPTETTAGNNSKPSTSSEDDSSSSESSSEESKTCSHTASDWIVTKEATETAEGTKVKTCTVCGTTLETASIAKVAHNHGYTWTYVSDGDYKVNKCSCGQETGERAYNLGNGVYGQWKDSMASDLMTWTNLQRGNTTTVPVDEIGNYLPIVVSPPLNNTLSSQAKTRALQCASDYSHNGMITTDECLAKGYDNARSVSSAWMASGDHRDSSVYYLYTQGGTACLWYDSDGNGTMNYIWVLTLDY